MSLIISVVLLILHLSVVIGQRQNTCEPIPPKGKLVEVHCDGRNYTNFPLAYVLPENTSVISFKDNKIQQLPDQLANGSRYKVWKIDLSGNVINQLLDDKLGKTFPNVSYLDLSNNKISLLSINSFKYLMKLHTLHLTYNELASISQDWFSRLLHLSWLDLGHNKIAVVNEAKHGWPKHIRNLYLSYNQLRAIPPLPPKASVSLIGNQIFCGCDFGVNKNISETLIKVNCHQLGYYRRPAEMQKGVTKYEKYRASVNFCKAATIFKFSYLIANGQNVLFCVVSFGYPPAAVFIYYEKKEIKRSRDYVILGVTEPGIYTCKVTNYISSDQREIHIPFLITTDITSESAVTTSSGFIDHTETKIAYHEWQTTRAFKHEVENTTTDQGIWYLIILMNNHFYY